MLVESVPHSSSTQLPARGPWLLLSDSPSVVLKNMASDWSQSEPLTAATFTSFTTRLASKQRLLQLQQQQQTDKNYRCMHTNCLSVRHGRNMSLDDMVSEHAPLCCCPVSDSELVLLINHGTGEGLILSRGFVCS